MNNSRHNFKTVTPCRNQYEMNLLCIDHLIPPDHKARAIWEFVEQIDNSPCYRELETYFGEAGRPATCPKVLFALWLYSILDGNSSARKLEELCKNHNAYKWLAGGVPINRTLLAEFRSKNPIKFEDLLTNSLAVMVKADLINDRDFSQDGTRVKANAGFNSFKREETLIKLIEDIKSYLKQLDKEAATNEYEKRKKEIAKSEAKERLHRVNEALKNLDRIREDKKKLLKKIELN